MAPTEQNTAIAERCGYNTTKEQLGGVFIYRDKDGNMLAALLNYHSDLNAVHEAWVNTNEEQMIEFDSQLETILRRDLGKGATSIEVSCISKNATAPQRCEALLRTNERVVLHYQWRV